MKHLYERQCWYCGSRNLVPDDRGVRCRSCGTTWNKLPESHGSPITIVNDPESPNFHYTEETYSKPSPVVLRSAAAARNRAKSKESPELSSGHD